LVNFSQSKSLFFDYVVIDCSSHQRLIKFVQSG
jgi:hypothetical protein